MTFSQTRNAQGQSRGFGFVEFALSEEAFQALSLNNSQLNGRAISVSQSDRPITAKKPVASGSKGGKGGKTTDGDVEMTDANANTAGSKGKGKMGPKGKGKKGKEGGKNGGFSKGKGLGKGGSGAAQKGGKGAKSGKVDLSASSSGPPPANGAASAPAGDAQQPLSNADFRKMLL